MEHYSFDIDEGGMSRKEVLELFLIRICDDLKEKLKTDSIKSNDNQTGISEAQLIIAGGDVYESYLIKTAFSSLNEPNKNDITQLNFDSDTLYLYQQLLNKTIILKSVSRNLPAQVNKYGLVPAGKRRNSLEHGSSIPAGKFSDFFR
jgi:hypothetical protein